jgi:hypothetical protein
MATAPTVAERLLRADPLLLADAGEGSGAGGGDSLRSGSLFFLLEDTVRQSALPLLVTAATAHLERGG